jgi:hypothetical protein
MTCEKCPFYLWKIYPKGYHSGLTRDIRENYCAHPAHIESYGVEQHMYATKPDEPVTEYRSCPVTQDDSVEALLVEARVTRFYFAEGTEMARELSPISALRPENAEGFHRG